MKAFLKLGAPFSVNAARHFLFLGIDTDLVNTKEMSTECQLIERDVWFL